MNEQAQRERERLRDEFAAAALTGLLASECTDETWIDKADFVTFARLAYRCADALLAHRDANPLPAQAQAPQ